MGILDRFINRATEAVLSRVPDGRIMVENAVRQGAGKGLRDSLVKTPRSMRVLELKDWTNAVMLATKAEDPNRTFLYDMYDSVTADLQLDSVIDSRVLAVLSSRFKLVGMNGEEDYVKTELLEDPWFEDFVRLVIEAEFWGDTLIDIFDTDENGLIANCEKVSRKHILWDKNLVVNKVGDTTGIDFTLPKFAPYYIPIKVKRCDGLGQLMKIAPVVLAKRWALAYWQQYAERYGMPFRSITTPGGNDKRDKALGEILENMGANGWAVFWEGEIFDMKEAIGKEGSTKVFDQLIARLDGYISKAVLGQTMTTDDGSSRAQAMVHEGVADDRHDYDRRRVKSTCNKRLFPQLIVRGYPFQNFIYDWDDQMSDADKLQRIISLSQSGYIVDPEWITEETGIPIIGTQAMQKQTEANATGQKKKPMSSFKKIVGALAVMYVAHGPCMVQAATPPVDEAKLTAIINRIIKLVYGGQLRGMTNADLSLIVATTLHESVVQAMPLDTIDYDAPDNAATAAIRNNIYAFAAAKSFSAIKAMTDSLLDVNGELKKFSDFKRDALAIHEQYNVDWLKSEYDHAVASAQQASLWLDFEKNIDIMPYLTYSTAGDDRVRSEHIILDGTTRPVKDIFWATHYPPNGWRCRCAALQSNDDAAVTSERVAKNRADAAKLAPMFNTNVGRSGLVFSDKHPYFSDVNGKVTELEAIRDYGMKPIDRLLADSRKLPEQQPDAADMDKWWSELKARRGFGSDNVTLKDRNGNALLLTPGQVKDAAIATNLESIVRSPSEIWATQSRTTYLRYHKDSVMAVVVDKDLNVISTSKSTIKEASKTFSNSRKGILMHR